MLKDRLTKEPSKADVQRKADAWKVLNEVLVKTNSEFMTKLSSMLAEKQTQHKQLQEKIEDILLTYKYQNTIFIEIS